MQDRNLYFILGVCLLGFYFSHSWNSPSRGKPVDMAFTATDGLPVDLSAMRGKVVLVDFWATWCGPCMQEVPNVVATYNALHAKGFEVIGISLDTDRSRLDAVTAQKGMVWPQYFDGKGWNNEIAASHGIHSIPTMWLFDKNGRLSDTDARNGLQEKVGKLLAQ